ncbi:MAG: hypothetical protein BMS9Abin09_0257 [Gammaproteobacteria bacterium]|nr:MAG: hypothetical protein BMS9Abin09_0257 [Gammaproteobacteria bacterium]
MRFVLLFGLPRSGTTWLGKIFDSDPNTLYRHEPDSHQRMGIPLFADPQDRQLQMAVQRYAKGIPDMRSVSVSGKLPLFRKNYLTDTQLGFYHLSILLAKAVGKLAPRFPLLYAPRGRPTGLPTAVWKSIESVGRIGLIRRAIPGSRVILIIRHPCGYVRSVQKGDSEGYFLGSVASSDDYDLFGKLLETEPARRYGLTLDKLRVLTPEQRLAWRWALYNEKAMLELEGLSDAMVVRYEDVCADPLGMAARMYEFAGMHLGPQTETFLKESTGRQNGGYYSVYKDPQKVAWRWQEELSPDRIESILAITRSTHPGAMFPE